MLQPTAADGIEIRADDEGSGPAVLVLPPDMDDGSSWQKVADLLATDYRVVRLQRRRFRLDLPAQPPCTLADEVGDALTLAAAIGGPLLLVGHSGGAVVSLEALTLAPEAFAGAVLYEPPLVIGPPLGGEAADRADAALAAGKPGRAFTIFFRSIVRMPRPTAWLIGHVLGLLPRFRDLARRQIDAVRAVDELGVRLDAYSGIELPIVLIGGERSPAHFGRRLDALAAALPHAERRTLRRQGHDGHSGDPDQVARIIREHAERVLRAAEPTG